MNEIFKVILELSILSSIVALVILCIRQIVKNKINSKWTYLLWGIFILALILPIKAKSSFSIYKYVPEVSNVDYKSEYNKVKNELQYNNVTKINDDTKLELKRKMDIVHAKYIIFEDVLPYIWLLGSLLVGSWLVISNVIFKSRLRQENCNTSKEKRNILMIF